MIVNKIPFMTRLPHQQPRRERVFVPKQRIQAYKRGHARHQTAFEHQPD